MTEQQGSTASTVRAGALSPRASSGLVVVRTISAVVIGTVSVGPATTLVVAICRVILAFIFAPCSCARRRTGIDRDREPRRLPRDDMPIVNADLC